MGSLSTAFTVLFAISFCHLLNDMMQSLLPAIYPTLKTDFHLSFTQIGLVTFTFQITASLLQPLVGLYADRRPMPFSLPIGMVFTPQAPGSGCTSSANCTPGSVVFDLTAPGSTGSPTEAAVQGKRGASPIFALGAWSGGPTQWGGLWLGSSAGPSSTNYTIIGDGAASTILNAPTYIYSYIGNAAQTILTSTAFYPANDLGLSVGSSLDRWSAVWSQAGITGGTSTSGNGATFYVEGEAGKSGTTTYNGGPVVVEGGNASGSTPPAWPPAPPCSASGSKACASVASRP